jgi:heme exporter protein A
LNLKVSDISKRFGRRWLFRDLSFELGSGRSLAITGSNGSGKTTLMRLIAGVLTPTRGSVELSVNGEQVDEDSRIFHLGFVAPYLQMYDGLTLRENLRFVQQVRSLPEDPEKIDRAIQQVGLEGRGDDFVATFSSGMKQRARFAILLVVDPRLLLLDEPTSNLDEAGVQIVEKIVRGATEAGKSVIIATNSHLEQSWCESSLNVGDFAK